MSFISNLVPEPLLKSIRPYYHGMNAILANIYYGQPSQSIKVIGVTGTSGKSTTIQMLARILNFAGKKCGYITTVEFFDGQTVAVNKHGLSMPGPWLLQKQLDQMRKKGCGWAVIECTSEGLAQNRHLGINFIAALFTNLFKAHLDAHGGFNNYLKAKQKLFTALAGKGPLDNKFIGVNLDDPYWEQFSKYPAVQSFGVTLQKNKLAKVGKIFAAEEVSYESSINFSLQGQNFSLKFFGQFNVYNALLAVACANMLNVPLAKAAEALADFEQVAGRMEEISNNLGVKIFIDYAPEPAGMFNVLRTVSQMPHGRLIHVFGATGGHRDAAKGFEFGKISAQFSDAIIITNDDVYDSDPEGIAKNIESGIRSFELWKGEIEIILDRRAAINRALSLAKTNDVVLITGKGSEQFLVLPGNKRMEWDEREVVRDELNKLSSQKSSSHQVK